MDMQKTTYVLHDFILKFLWVLCIYFCISLIYVLYLNETRFNAGSYIRKQAIVFEAKDLTHEKIASLQGKLVAVTGVAHTTDLLEDGAFLKGPANLVAFKSVEQRQKTKARGGSYWRTEKKKTLFGHTLVGDLPVAIPGLVFLPFHKPIEIELSSPSHRALIYAIEPNTPVTVVGTFELDSISAYRHNYGEKSGWVSYLPYGIEIPYREDFPEQHLFYITDGTLEELIAKIEQSYHGSQRAGRVLFLFLLSLVVLAFSGLTVLVFSGLYREISLQVYKKYPGERNLYLGVAAIAVITVGHKNPLVCYLPFFVGIIHWFVIVVAEKRGKSSR